MRYIALIFAFLIFGQSLSVCAPEIAFVPKDVATQVCNTAPSNDKKHSCCKSKEHDTEEEKNEGCCGEGCKCFSCIKVFVHYLIGKTQSEFTENTFTERNTSIVLVHSFDFHYTLINPPQV